MYTHTCKYTFVIIYVYLWVCACRVIKLPYMYGGQSGKDGGEDKGSSKASQDEGRSARDEAQAGAPTAEREQTQPNNEGLGDTVQQEPEQDEQALNQQQRQQMQDEADKLYKEKRELALAYRSLSSMVEDVNKEIRVVDAFCMSKGIHVPGLLPDQLSRTSDEDGPE